MSILGAFSEALSTQIETKTSQKPCEKKGRKKSLAVNTRQNKTVRAGRGGALTMIQKSETLDTDLRGLMPPGLENNPMDTLLVPKGTVADFDIIQYQIF